MIKNSYYMPGTANTVLYVSQSAPKTQDSINTTVGALTETRVVEAPGASGPLARLPSSLADTLDVEQLHQPALLNHVIPCQLGAYTETLLPRQDAFHAHSADKSLSSRLHFPFRARALAPVVHLRPGLIPGCFLPSAVNKIGPLTGQKKTLFGLAGPDGQMPAICFTLQIRLGEIKAAAEEAEEIRRRLEGDIMFSKTTRDGDPSTGSGSSPETK